MSSWYPTSPLEEEIVAMQPDHNFIYGDLADHERNTLAYRTRPRDHLEHLQKQKFKNQTPSNQHEMPGGCSLKTIRAVHEIAGTKQLGMSASVEDWDMPENVGKETIAMIRHFGMGPSVDLPLDKNKTLPTMPVTKRTLVKKNGEDLLPVLLNENDFKIETTRNRNAKAINALTESLNGLNSSKTENDIKPLAYEALHQETVQVMEERENKEFLEEYPTSEQQRTSSSKKKQKKSKYNRETENWRAPSSVSKANFTQPKQSRENWRVRNSIEISKANTSPNGDSSNWRALSSQSLSSTSYFTSVGSDSTFFSLNSPSSDEYASALENLHASSNSDQVKTTTRSSAKMLQPLEMPKKSSLNVENNLRVRNAQFLTPKDVYNNRKMFSRSK